MWRWLVGMSSHSVALLSWHSLTNLTFTKKLQLHLLLNNYSSVKYLAEFFLQTETETKIGDEMSVMGHADKHTLGGGSEVSANEAVRPDAQGGAEPIWCTYNL